MTLVTVGRVGKPHGHDGSFYVDGASAELTLGEIVTVREATHRVTRRAGTADRPLIRLEGVDDPRPLRGEPLLADTELAEDEWLAADLVGRAVEGRGRVERVLDGPSCSVLELSDGTLVPFVRDAVKSVGADVIEIDEGFLT